MQLCHLHPISSFYPYTMIFRSKEDIENFLSPKLDQLQSPADLAMIDQAVKRVKNAIMNDEKILIYGDYDADGVTSTTLLLKTIQELEGHCTFYIPNRLDRKSVV